MHTAPPPPPARAQVSHEPVTREDIEAIERQLALIDARNKALFCVSNWLSVFQLAQVVCDRFEEVGQKNQQDLALVLHSALIKTRDRGRQFAEMAALDVLAITNAHFQIGTGHTQGDLAACIQYLDDRINQWFVEEKPSEVCTALITEGSHESESVVP